MDAVNILSVSARILEVKDDVYIAVMSLSEGEIFTIVSKRIVASKGGKVLDLVI